MSNSNQASRLDELERKVSKFDQSQSFWKRACLALTLLCSVSFFMGQKPPPKDVNAGRVTADKVTTKSLRILGADGKLRGLFNTTKKGSSSLALLDGNQKVRTTTTVSADGSSKLSYIDHNGKIVMTLSLGSKKHPALIFKDSAGITRVGLTTEPAAVIFSDTAGKVKAMLAVSKKGNGVLLPKK
jgi:hypothetical protein